MIALHRYRLPAATGSVTDVNYHPLPGYVGNITGAQLQNLDKLKVELAERPRSFCEGKNGRCDAFKVVPVNFFQ